MYRNKNDFNKLSALLGYTFKNQKLLLRALTRTSALNEGLQSRDIQDFQQLEFIGDGILDTVIRGVLVSTHPHWREGQLTQEKIKWVNNSGPLARVAQNLNLGEFLIMGKGEERLNLRQDIKVLSDAMEALIGAIWIDSGKNYEGMEQFIVKHWSAIGLIPSVYKTLAEIIRNEQLSESDKITQFNTAFSTQLLTQEQLEEIFTLAINECEEVEIVEIILNTKKIKLVHLNEALITSIEQGINEQVKLLLNNDADANAVVEHYPGYDRSLSMLQLAIIQLNTVSDEPKETLEIIETLLQYHADPDWQDSVTTISREAIRQEAREQMQAWHSICFPELDEESFGGGGYAISDLLTFEKKDGKLVMGLKARPEKPAIQHKNLKTALHTIAEIDSTAVPAVITLLLRYGANLHLKDDRNKTARDIIEENYADSKKVSLMHNLDDILKLLPKTLYGSLSNKTLKQFDLLTKKRSHQSSNNNNITNTQVNISHYYGHFLNNNPKNIPAEEKHSSPSTAPTKTYSCSDDES